MKMILASSSPRRQLLLREIIDDFEIKTSFADESFVCQLPQENVMRVARMKLNSIEPENDTVYISADTTVYMDGKYFNKPKSVEEAREMLELLSGKTHKVYTGVCIRYNGKIDCFYDCASVEFNLLSDEYIDNYIATGSPMDKAGAYGIQDKGVVKSFNGDYNTIMGLPVDMLKHRLEEIMKNGN